MTLQAGSINQKEYLKKYLSKSEEKKKKKKKKIVTGAKRITIIDDDIDLKNMRNINTDELELYQLSEDAPVIAGIIDERPLEVQLGDKYNDKRWKVVSGIDDEIQISDKNDPKRTQNIKKNMQYNNDSDISPPRKSRKNDDSDISPPRKPKKDSRGNDDSDISPPRKYKKVSRRNDDSDISPPRKSKKNSDSDISPPRKSRKNNLSPPSKSKYSSSSRKSYKSYIKESDSDISPPRKSRKNNNRSPPKKTRKDFKKDSDSDLSPPRKSRWKQSSPGPSKQYQSNSPPPSHKKFKVSRKGSDSDLSPPRKSNKLRKDSDSDISPPRIPKKDLKIKNNRGSDSDLSPPRKPSVGSSNKMSKTLDGKSAGLQDAKQLVKENQEFKQREDELFRKMKASVSGADASTVVRDRKTGRVRDFEEEARIARKKEEKEYENKEKYDKWGRGLKQTQDFQNRVASDLHEMSKPLARYREDEDLEKELKDRMRMEDPMFQYVMSKKEKEQEDVKPKYKGPFPPNRYNIPPGYRWDGVDRSNGFEKEYFLSKSSKKAMEEEAYHWSISDM